ncbi:MAG: DinB family protein [Acidobacteria bacterium]|nr:MAG: DinB family protein [Acidobacteriota bacterium]
MKNMAQTPGQRLKETVQEEGAKLRAVPEREAAARPGGGEGWSRKQELGHLIDSATNNRMRFIVAVLNRNFTGPTYDGRGWVELGGYADAPWADLVELWVRSNDALARVIERIPNERLSAHCKVGDADPVSLEFLIDDYLLHMQHHLDHILGRERQTAYPGSLREELTTQSKAPDA